MIYVYVYVCIYIYMLYIVSRYSISTEIGLPLGVGASQRDVRTIRATGCTERPYPQKSDVKHIYNLTSR